MIVTTSRHASKKLKDVALSFSNDIDGKYINRGKKTINDLVLLSLKYGIKKITIITSKEKKDCLKVLGENNWKWL